MDTQKLHDLIDKVIGKSGPLRTPAWWMRRVLRDILDTIKDSQDSLNRRLNNGLSALDSKFTALDSGNIKKIQRYTYKELQIKVLNNDLIPGQTYRMSHEVTISKIPDGLQGFYSLGSDIYVTLLLTAKSTNSFDSDAIAIYAGKLYNVKYSFDKTKNFAWCKKKYEVDGFKATINEELCEFTPNGLVYGYWSYITLEHEDINMISFNTNEEIRVGYSRTIYKNNISYRVEIVEVVDDFEGVIYEWYDPISNVRAPFPIVGYCPVYFSFSIERENMEPYDVAGSAPWGSNKNDNRWRNVTIRPYSKDGVFCWPRVVLDIVGASSYQDAPSYVGYNSTNIYITRLSGGNYNDNLIHIGDHCGNIFIDQTKGQIKILEGSDHICCIGCGAKFIGSAERMTIVGHHATPAYEFPVIGHVGDVYLDIRKDDAESYTKVMLLSLPKLKEGEDTRIIELAKVGAFDYCTIGMDSNGNIRCWNPADFVDAVEPEEQTVEQSETVEE